MFIPIKAYFHYLFMQKGAMKHPYSYYYSFYKAKKEARKRTKYYTKEYYENNLKLSDEYIPKFKNQN